MYRMLAGTVFLAGLLVLSRWFPPLNTDELMPSVHGHNWLSGHGNRYSLYDDVFIPSAYELRDAFPDQARFFHNIWTGVWLKLGGRRYEWGRASSVFAGFLALVLFWGLGRTEDNRPRWAMVALAALNPAFLTASSLMRPEALLLMSSVLLVWMAVRVPDAAPWKNWVLGVLGGMQVGVHPNAAVFSPGFLAYLIVSDVEYRRAGPLVKILLGYAAGISLSLAFVDMTKLLLAQEVFFKAFFKPPVFSFPWHPLGWANGTIRSILEGNTFYVNPRLAGGWSGAWFFSWLGFGGMWLLAVLRFKSWTRQDRALHAGLAVSFLFLVALVARKEALYSVVLYPFLIPICVKGISVVGNPRFMLFARYACLGLTVAGAVHFFSFVREYKKTYSPVPRWQGDLASKIGDPNARVMGPNTFWFNWPADRFRDIGALLYSRWYSGGEGDVGRSLKGWKPDVVVVGPDIKRIIGKNRPFPDVLAETLEREISDLGTVETGPGNHGALEIYRIHWNEQNENS